jgi:hypothetical protein
MDVAKSLPQTVVSESNDSNKINPYETDNQVNLYNAFHWGDRISIFGNDVPRFPVLCSLICEDVITKSDLWL